MLPRPAQVRALVAEAHARYQSVAEGAVSQVYPALAAVDPDLFGIAVASTRGDVFSVGHAEVEFTIMSVAKPFVFALVCDAIGPEDVRRHVGVNATGLPFNSLEAIEQSEDGRTNPMVNPGAIATTSLAPGDNPRAAGAWSATASRPSRGATSRSTTTCTASPARRTT